MQYVINEAGDRCAIGVLVMELGEDGNDTALDETRKSLEQSLRDKYAGSTRAELKDSHPIDSYVSYYKKFGKNYHVLGQLESIIKKGKSIPDALPLVEAMFMAELKNALLTAGHDVDILALPLRATICTGSESFIAMGGKESTMVESDVMLYDAVAPVSSILRGPDARTAISADTRRVLYIVYAPVGIEADLVMDHLTDIEHYVNLYSHNAMTTFKNIIS